MGANVQRSICRFILLFWLVSLVSFPSRLHGSILGSVWWVCDAVEWCLSCVAVKPAMTAVSDRMFCLSSLFGVCVYVCFFVVVTETGDFCKWKEGEKWWRTEIDDKFALVDGKCVDPMRWHCWWWKGEVYEMRIFANERRKWSLVCNI